MPKKTPLGRRHKKGTGNFKDEVAKRLIVHTQVGCAKKHKKKSKEKENLGVDFGKKLDESWDEIKARWAKDMDEFFERWERALAEP